MSEIFTSSFIPKKAFKKKEKKRGGKISILFLISLIIFLSSLVSLFGIYLWKLSLNEQIIKLNQSLKKKSENYDLAYIKKLSNLSKRISSSARILENHYNILPIFQFLEKSTLTNIQLTKLSLREKDNEIIVNSNGSARSLLDIQIQSESYAKNSRVNNLVLSNLVNDKKGNWFFDIYFTIDKKYLTKAKFLNN